MDKPLIQAEKYNGALWRNGVIKLSNKNSNLKYTVIAVYQFVVTKYHMA